MTATVLARELEISASKLSRMERGDRGVSEADLAVMIPYFGLGEAAAGELRSLARSARRRRSLVPQPDSSGYELQRIEQSGFVELERDAESVREFNAGVIPGLLQTEGYMRAVMSAAVPDDDSVVDEAVDLRLRRQDRLHRRGGYVAIVDEAVLARIVGSPAVMAEQLEDISRRVIDEDLDIRVIPFSAGAYRGANGMFVALAMEQAPDVVFAEGPAWFFRFDKPDEVRRFESTWSALIRIASPPEESIQLLRTYVSRLRQT